MCGGNLNVQEGSKITTCEYCQTQQTVPSTDDEKRANLFNRANHFRQNSEFDKAMGIYEHILAEDSTDAEAYWSIVLCKYGIEYVEDPVSKVLKPTVNRTQSQSILADADYLMALEHADYAQKEIYEKEATEIEQIQKGILIIAKNEKPYDIFISYKEKTSTGERTKSSIIAHDIYNHLEKEGYRVFFSRVSLEDKVGQKYEPYIYSALNSSKVMLVIGTEKDEFVAPWVRNEWSRFLTLMRSDASKLLIPCFRDLEIYDLPNEFQILQSQDMSKIGFEQDLLHGISKIINNTDNKIEKFTHSSNNPQSLERLVQNAETYMKLQNYESAYDVYQNITRLYPEDYRGWWGLIHSSTRDFTSKDIENVKNNIFNQYLGYVKQLASEDIYKEKLNQYINYLKNVSQSQAVMEIGFVEEVIRKYRTEIDKLNTQIANISGEEEKRRQEFQRQDEKLKSTIDDCKNTYYRLTKEAERIFTSKVIAWGVLLGSIVFGFLLAGCSEPLGAVLFWIGGLLGIILVKTIGKKGSASGKQRQAVAARTSVSGYEEIRATNEKDFEREIRAISARKKPYYGSIEQYKQRISECSKYLGYGKEEIAELLFVLDCKKMGVDKECNLELFGLRNDVMKHSVIKGDVS